MRVHWFSPLPAARTDIADYTRRLLPALAARAEVTLWTAQPRWSPALRHVAEVRRFDPTAALAPELREGAIFYNIGNDSAFHAAIWEVARQAPGFAILHDVFLHDSIAHSFQVRADRARYLEAMRALYGERGRRDAELYWKGALAMPQMGRRYTCARYILDHALGAVTHSRLARRTIERETALPVEELALPFPARRMAIEKRADGPPWRLIVFGYLGSNRCLVEALEAMAAAGPALFHLDIYGQMEGPVAAQVASVIERLGLAEQVTMRGFVAGAALERALASADLALNLRFPTKGEASGSQLRIWSHALPALVSRIGWYAELPAGTVAAVRPEALVEDIAAHLKRYAADPAPYREAGRRGRDYLIRTHAPERYAEAIVKLAAQAPERRGRLQAERLGRRVAGVIEGWFEGERVAGYDAHLAGILAGMA